MNYRQLQRIFVLALVVLGFSASTNLFAAKWHHVHLTTADTSAAAQWYAEHMDGEVVNSGMFDVAVFGEALVVFRRSIKEFEGSDGSSVDHIGWSFADLDAKMASFEAAGIKIIAPARSLGKIKFGFIEDPWGTKIEVMQDPDLIGFHHVHLHVTDPPAVQQWYVDSFGGEIARYGGFLPAVKYDNMWLIVQKTKEEKAGTSGRSVDHLGWRYEDLDAAIADLDARGISLLGNSMNIGALTVAFIEGPGGVKIEIVQNNPPASAPAE